MVGMGLKCSPSVGRNCAQAPNHEVNSTAGQGQELETPMPLSLRRRNDPGGKSRGILLVLRSEMLWKEESFGLGTAKDFHILYQLQLMSTGSLELCAEPDLEVTPRLPGK